MDNSVRHVYGSFSATKFDVRNLNLDFSGLSFEKPVINEFGPYTVFLRADLILFNTIEEYKNADVKVLYSKRSKLNSWPFLYF